MRLTLAKETIQVISADQVAQVRGGIFVTDNPPNFLSLAEARLTSPDVGAPSLCGDCFGYYVVD